MNEIMAPKILEELLQEAEKRSASDVHLQMIGKRATVSLRLDGVLTAFSELEELVAERVFGRIKFLAKLKTYQETLPQDGRINNLDVGTTNDIRVSTYPTITGEKIVLRMFLHSSVKPLEEIGLPIEAQQIIQNFLHQTLGMLLLTGPAGSGKTTTIYACLDYLKNLGGRHIITVEDPVEQIIPQIMQTNVDPKRGLSFAAAAKHLLRQDPQVLVIGEINDQETAEISVNSAFTGHMIITTLHAGSCQGVYERLLMLCKDPYITSAALSCIINQRLLRRVCSYCQSTKCDSCSYTGYSGRIPVLEWMEIDEEKRKLLRDQNSDCLIPKVTLRDHARQLMAEKIIDSQEFMRVFGK